MDATRFSGCSYCRRVVLNMAERISQSQFAVLGLLSMEPMSGYDLKQLSAWSVGHFWRESYGQIYPTLRQLEKQRLVTRRTQRQKGKPDRNEYSITNAGRNRLKKWLALPPNREVPRNELLLKLFFGGQVSGLISRNHLEEHRQSCELELSDYAEVRRRLGNEHKNHPDRPFWEMTLNYGEHMARAQMAWCEESIKKLKGRK
jgi:PadR family transcriptional regulator AphA